MCNERLSSGLRAIAAVRPQHAAYLALVATVGAPAASGAPGEVVTLLGLSRALPGLPGRILKPLAEELVQLGVWSRHPDGYLSEPGDTSGPASDADGIARRRATFRRSSARYRAEKKRGLAQQGPVLASPVATPIATPPEPPVAEIPTQGVLTEPELQAETCFGQQALPGITNGSAERVNTVNTSRQHRQHDHSAKPSTKKKKRDKSPKDLRLELIAERYTAAYAERYATEPGAPAWSLVQRVETWASRNAPKIGKTFAETVDLVISGYFRDNEFAEFSFSFRILSEDPARHYRAAMGLNEPRRRRRYIAPAPPAPPGAFDGDNFEQNMADMVRAAEKITQERAERAEKRKAERLAAKQSHMR